MPHRPSPVSRVGRSSSAVVLWSPVGLFWHAVVLAETAGFEPAMPGLESGALGRLATSLCSVVDAHMHGPGRARKSPPGPSGLTVGFSWCESSLPHMVPTCLGPKTVHWFRFPGLRAASTPLSARYAECVSMTCNDLTGLSFRMGRCPTGQPYRIHAGGDLATLSRDWSGIRSHGAAALHVPTLGATAGRRVYAEAFGAPNPSKGIGSSKRYASGVRTRSCSGVGR